MNFHHYPLAYVVVTLISIMLSAFIGLILFFNSRINKANRTLSVFIIYISVWITLNYIALVYENIYVLRILYVILLFLFPILIKSTLELRYNDWGKWWQKIALFLPPFVFAPIILGTPYLIAGVSSQDGIIEISNSGPLLKHFYYIIFAYIAIAIYIIIVATRRSNRIIRTQLVVIWTIAITSLSVAVIDQYIMPMFGISTFTPYRSVMGLFLSGTIWIVVTRFYMLNSKVIFSEIWAFILSLVLLIQLVYDPDLGNTVVFVAVITTVWLVVRSVYADAEKSSELNLVNRQLARDKNELVKLDEAKTEFVTMTSHELLTPISAIEGYLSMLVDEKLLPINDKRLIKYLNSMYGSAKRVAGLVTDLLNVSRIEEHRLMVKRTEFDICSLIRLLKEELMSKSDGSSIKIVYDNTKCVPLVYADRDNISEVLINLMSNAIKYNKPSGKVEITVTIWPTKTMLKAYKSTQRYVQRSTRAVLSQLIDPQCQVITGSEQVVISVKDDGIGLTPSDIKLLFKKFSRVVDWEHISIQGTGLGLYISQALATMNHGRIWVNSPGRGKGSTFYLSLPLAKNKEKVAEFDKCMKIDKNAKPLAKSADMVDAITE